MNIAIFFTFQRSNCSLKPVKGMKLTKEEFFFSGLNLQEKFYDLYKIQHD